MARRSKSGDTFIQLNLEDSRVIKGLRNVQARLGAIGGTLQRMGRMGLAAGGGIAGAFGGLAKMFASVGDNIDKMSQRTGFASEMLSGLIFAAEQSGQTGGQMESVLIGMTRQIRNLERGLSTAVEGFEDLGLSYEDIKGLSPEDQFFLMAERLSKIEDPTRRAGIAMQVFGRSGRNLIPLLSMGEEGIRGLVKEADQLGITMSEDDTKAAAELTDAMNRVWTQIRTVAVQVGAAVAGPLTDLLNRSTEITRQVIDWVKNNRPLIITVAAIGAAVFAAGAGITALGVAASVASIALGGILAIATAVLSPVGLLISSVTALAGWFLTSTTQGQKLIGFFGELGGIVGDTVGGIVAALTAGDMEAATEILWAGLKLLWLQGTSFLRKKWTEFVTGITSLWHQGVSGLASLGTQAFGAIERAWLSVTNYMGDAWDTVQALLSKSFLSMAAFFEKTWARVSAFFTGGDATKEIERINKELAQTQKILDSQRNSSIAKRGKDAEDAREASLASQRAILDGIADDLQAKLASASDGEQEALKRQQEQLNAAREKFGELNDAVKEAAEAVKSQTEETVKPLQAAVAAAGTAVGLGGGSAAGAFSVGALRGLGATTDDEVAKNTKRTNTLLERIEKKNNTMTTGQ